MVGRRMDGRGVVGRGMVGRRMTWQIVGWEVGAVRNILVVRNLGLLEGPLNEDGTLAYATHHWLVGSRQVHCGSDA